MAQYNVTYGCGHTVIEQLYGSRAERERKIVAAQNRECPDCRRATEDADAKSVEQALNLPPLSGSDKQVAWARSIRAKMVQELRETTSKATPEVQAKYAPVIAAFFSQAQAKYWIDNRYADVKDLFRAFYRAQQS